MYGTIMDTDMTVLQQVKDYYLRFSQSTIAAARDKILTSEGVKDHPVPQDYLANRMQEQQNQPQDEPRAPLANRGRFLSKDA